MACADAVLRPGDLMEEILTDAIKDASMKASLSLADFDELSDFDDRTPHFIRPMLDARAPLPVQGSVLASTAPPKRLS